MSNTTSHTQTLLEHLPVDRRAELAQLGDLEEELEKLLHTAKTAWPQLRVDDHMFIRYVADRLTTGLPAPAALRRIRADQLYLACACVAADEGAATAFRDAFSSRIKAVLARARLSDVEDDILQDVLTQLLVGRSDKGPDIREYAGRGDLGAWTAIIALRTARRHVQKSHRYRLTDDNLLFEMVVEHSDSELLQLKQLYREPVRAAFESALAALSARDRNILRYELLDGMSVVQIAEVYSVHKTTILRWRAAARNTLFHGIRNILGKELKVHASELESIIRLVQSSLELSWARLLDAEHSSTQ